MDYLSFQRAPRILVLFIFCLLCVNGCKSTVAEDSQINCRSETNENCSLEDDNGDDRGYNPCLVNKNLPVCTK